MPITSLLALKTPWSSGTTHLVLSPFELIEKLAALVPPPRLNLIRYHGILAPNAAFRQLIVPQPQHAASSIDQKRSPEDRKHRLTWAALLARVFRIDVSTCPACGGPMRIVAALTDPDSIRRYLNGVGLPAEPPYIAPARPPPQQNLVFAA